MSKKKKKKNKRDVIPGAGVTKGLTVLCLAPNGLITLFLSSLMKFKRDPIPTTTTRLDEPQIR